VRCPADGSTAAVDQSVDQQEEQEVAQADGYSGEDDDGGAVTDPSGDGSTRVADNSQTTLPNGIETQFDDGTPHVPPVVHTDSGQSTPTNADGIETQYGL